MEQICKVITDDYDAASEGPEWRVHYVLYETIDDSGGEFDGRTCFDLYDDDGAGNGNRICRGYHQGEMIGLTLKLGRHIEWRAGVPLRSVA